MLEAHLEAVQARLRELRGSPTVQEASIQYANRLQSQGREDRVLSALWCMGLLAWHLSPQFPLRSLDGQLRPHGTIG